MMTKTLSNPSVLPEEVIVEAWNRLGGSEKFYVAKGYVQFSRAVENLMLEHLSKTGELSHWLDISTAPKDGTKILISGAGVWAAAFWKVSNTANCPGYWVDLNKALRWVGPTHWMPVPKLEV
jgi:hypothetical protein